VDVDWQSNKEVLLRTTEEWKVVLQTGQKGIRQVLLQGDVIIGASK
jgi:hypothetical protein